MRVILSGLSDLAEIAILVGGATINAEIIAIYDQKDGEATFNQIPVFNDLTRLPESDLAIVTSLNNPTENYYHLIEEIPTEKVYLPRVLGIKL